MKPNLSMTHSGRTLMPPWQGFIGLILFSATPWRGDKLHLERGLQWKVGQPGSSWGGAMRMSSLWKNKTIGKLNLSLEIHLVDTIMFYNIVQNWKIQVPSSLFYPCPVGATSGLHPMFQLSATASPRSMWLGLTFTDRGEPRHSSFFGCLKALETGGDLEVTHNKPADFMGEEC